MKKSLLIVSLLLYSLSLCAQKDSVSIFSRSFSKAFARENTCTNVNIYPVPVRDNSFSIKTDREMTLVKVTNMIGQDIFRAQYKNPLSFTKINLENPARGIYLVTVAFIDGSRVVKKIMIENPE